MIEVVREVVADVTIRSTSKLVVAKQNDAGSRFLNVRIKDNGKSLDIPTTSKVILNAQRPDNSVGTFYGSVNDVGTVRVELNSWILEQAGTIACDISVINENSVKLTTMTFYVDVEAAVCGDDAIEEQEEYSVIVDLLSKTESAAKQAEEAAQDATILRENCENATQEARDVTAQAEELVDNLEEYYNDALDNMLQLQEDLLTSQGIEVVVKKPQAGFIYPLASEIVPEGFLLCDGAQYLRADYPELFAAIGTIYGAGDGSTTFNVPNLSTRVPVGAGDKYELGQIGGEAENTLTEIEMPSHRHGQTAAIAGYSGWNSTDIPTDNPTVLYNYNGISQTVPQEIIYTNNFGGTYNIAKVSSGAETAIAGAGMPHNNMQPYTVVNYIIATGKDTAVSVADIVLGAQAIPLEVQYGGTGATGAVQARENLGVYSKEYVDDLAKPVLLWENANYLAEMPAQYIELGDVSAYSEYIIQTVNHGQFRTKVGRYIHLGYNNIYDTGAQFFHRGVCLHDYGGLQVADCRVWNKAHETTRVWNEHLIIEAVYGIKGVD